MIKSHIDLHHDFTKAGPGGLPTAASVICSFSPSFVEGFKAEFATNPNHIKNIVDKMELDPVTRKAMLDFCDLLAETDTDFLAELMKSELAHFLVHKEPGHAVAMIDAISSEQRTAFLKDIMYMFNTAPQPFVDATANWMKAASPEQQEAILSCHMGGRLQNRLTAMAEGRGYEYVPG